jgi:SMI1 / KNR4 family.
MVWDSWKEKWENTCNAIRTIGGESNGVLILDKSTEEKVIEIEKVLGMKLPDAFRKVVLEFSSGVDFEWSLPDDFELQEEFSSIFAGQFTWNLKEIPEINRSKDEWVKDCFPNQDDPYDKVWHNKLGLMEVGNGDFIAFDLQEYPQKTPIVYLSHDDGEGHGYILGDDFIDFMDKWTNIGCPGLEDWQMLPFIDSPTSGINPNCENAMAWKKLIGLKF